MLTIAIVSERLGYVDHAAYVSQQCLRAVKSARRCEISKFSPFLYDEAWQKVHRELAAHLKCSPRGNHVVSCARAFTPVCIDRPPHCLVRTKANRVNHTPKCRRSL